MSAEFPGTQAANRVNLRDPTAGIFLSYAGVDRAVATQIVQGLRAAGANVWWDQGIGWGDRWVEQLQERLSLCSAYLILIGASGVGRWVRAELLVANQRHVEEDLPIFPILLDGVEPESLPSFLKVFQARRLPKDLEQLDFSELAEQLRVIRGAPEDARTIIQKDVCPFPGLEAFHEDDAPFFFGRQIETLDALRRLGHDPDGPYRRWLQIEGPSGIGKTSLVGAGLVPAIKHGWLEEEGRKSGAWRVAPPMRPGADPIVNLAESLKEGLSSETRPLTVTSLDRNLRDGGNRALLLLMRDNVDKGERFVLLIDQLEEVFTLTGKAEDRERFDALLATALDDNEGPLHLISTIRSDFMLRYAELPRLAALLNQSAGRYFLLPMSEAGLRLVVHTPASLADLKWSDADLPGEIVQEAVAEPGALPLVGNLLRLLWDERDGKTLSRRVYDELGGLGGALATRADMLLESLGGDGKERARKLLLELVEPGRRSQDTRRSITRAQALAAAGGGPGAEAVLDRLSGLRTATTSGSAKAMPRLVVVSSSQDGQEDDARARVDLAHEALLRDDRSGKPYWKTLRNWVNEYRKQLEDRRLLEILAEKWQEGGRSWWSNELARGRQLREFRRAAAAVSDLAADYLRASQRLNWSRSAAVVAAVVLVACIGFGSWWVAKKGPGVAWRLLALRAGWASVVAPETVSLPAGEFVMGATEDTSEQPPHIVQVPAFAIGKYEVTFDEWDVCVLAGGCNGYWPYDVGWGRGRRPAHYLSWEDAQAYVKWLSHVTGDIYRLPSEAEWEYAGRAGTTTRYSWGDDITPKNANYLESDIGKTAEVGAYPPNHWGLHDMNGNVWEWVEDCLNRSYEGRDRPDDGNAWRSGDCDFRMLRGGSLVDRPENLRSASRISHYKIDRLDYLGFRIARTLR